MKFEVGDQVIFHAMTRQFNWEFVTGTVTNIESHDTYTVQYDGDLYRRRVSDLSHPLEVENRDLGIKIIDTVDHVTTLMEDNRDLSDSNKNLEKSVGDLLFQNVILQARVDELELNAFKSAIENTLLTMCLALSTPAPLKVYEDDMGDEWHEQPDGTYRMWGKFSGGLCENRRSYEHVRNCWGPLTLVHG